MYITCWLATDGKGQFNLYNSQFFHFSHFLRTESKMKFCRNFKTSFTPMLVVTKMSGTSGCYDDKIST